MGHQPRILTIVLLVCAGCSISDYDDDPGYFQYFAEAGTVELVVSKQGFTCVYTPPLECSTGKQHETWRGFVETSDHVDEMRAVASYDALVDYNAVHQPDLELCELPPGSLYLGYFMTDYQASPGGHAADEPTLIADDSPDPGQRSRLKLPPEAVEASVHARRARRLFFDMMERCEAEGAPMLRP